MQAASTRHAGPVRTSCERPIGRSGPLNRARFAAYIDVSTNNERSGSEKLQRLRKRGDIARFDATLIDGVKLDNFATLGLSDGTEYMIEKQELERYSSSWRAATWKTTGLFISRDNIGGAIALDCRLLNGSHLPAQNAATTSS